MSTTRQRVADCSFCRKPNDEVGRLIAGPGVFICDRCVALSARILAEEGAGHDGAMGPWDREMPLSAVLATLGPVAAAGEQAQRSLELWVAKARGLGATWTQIGEALGITRQSAWGRFSGEE